MYLEKPSWIKHAGLQIFSLDIQPTGHRVATAGGDHKVRIWNMKKLVSVSPVLDDQPKLLATLHDHFGSVNCVRWAKSGRYLASGSDDHNVIIHERRPGTVTAEFGSGEPPDVENWKVVMTFRGHTSDVVDLEWSPDDSMLASCSLDNTVRVWDASNGAPVAILKDHHSLVKGVTWDPIGSFLASQSDDRGVIIWHTSSWTLAHRAEGSWEKSVGSTFFMRLDWSPCGYYLTTTNGFQKPSHTAPVLKRAEWGSSFHFVGHTAPIIAVRFNHAMFKKRPLANGTDSSDPVTKKESIKDKPYNVIAMGSQDSSVSVWTTATPRPVCVAKHFFAQSVVDLSWSLDGYSLLCCSLDGTVTVFEFHVHELGQRLGNEEMDEIKRKVYGDVRVKQLALAESPGQLILEAKNVSASGPVPALATPSFDGANGHVSAHDGLPPSEVAEGTTAADQDKDLTIKAVPKKVAQPSVVKQTEYRRPDGRKRIIPEALGMPSGVESHDGFCSRPELQNKLSKLGTGDVGGSRKAFLDSMNGNLPLGAFEGVSTKTGFSNGLRFEPKQLATPDAPGLGGVPEGLITLPRDPNSLGVLSFVGPAGIGGSGEAACLEAKPIRVTKFGSADGLGFDAFETDVICSQGGEVRWRDRLMGRPTTLAGNSVFWAVALDGGLLQIYTQAGRRALPSLMVGSPAAFMDCGEGWKLLLLTCQGSIHLWDVKEATCILHESLAPLYNSYFGSSEKKDVASLRVVSARLSRAGVPVVVLANRHAFMYHVGMKCWWRIADDTFPGSDYISKGRGNNGELAAIHAQDEKSLWKKFAWSAVGGNEQIVTRANLEVQMSAAVALKSADEYCHCLIAYVRCLTRDSDEGRLRELCEEFLGPVGSLDSMLQWESELLGLKKRDLLHRHILPAMASNRSVQRLTQEISDLLCELQGRLQS